MKTETQILTCEGHAVNENENHWTVECPNCDSFHEYVGFFDAAQKEVCTNCGKTFIVNKLWVINDVFYLD